MTTCELSVSERLAAAFAGMPPILPAAVSDMCDAVLMDVTGLCVAARNSDYLHAALQATAEPGICTLIGRAGGFNLATAALCNGIAGSMASGIIEYLAEGAWTKRMHPGWAAQAGYRAARLAQAGFTGPRTLFDGEHGFFHAFANSDGCDFTAMLDGVGTQWLAADIAFKPYACGTMAHPYIDCARRLVSEGLDPEEVLAIECKTAEGIVHRLWEPLVAKQRPPNGYAAKFSIPYAIAVGMLRDDAGLGEFEESVVHDAAVRALAGKVRYVVDPDNPYPHQFTGHLRVTLKSGEVRETHQGHFRGGREEPLSAAAIKAKFVANCTYGGWDSDRARSALDALHALRGAARVDLTALRC